MKTVLSVMCALLMALYANAQDIEKSYKLKNFTGVSANHVEVRFTQGKDYLVKAKGPEKYMSRFRAYNDGSMLKLVLDERQNQREDNNDGGKILVEVMCPVLNEVEIGGVAVFIAGDLENAGDFKVEMSGASRMSLGNLTCKSLDVLTAGATYFKVGDVKSLNNMKLTGGGVSCLNFAKLDIKEYAYLDCGGSSSVKLNLLAKGVEMCLTGSCHGEISVNSDKMTSIVAGAGNLDLTFRGREIKVENTGAGKFNLDTDCKVLRAQNSGTSCFIITGTADDVKVECGGTSQINLKGLNHF